MPIRLEIEELRPQASTTLKSLDKKRKSGEGERSREHSGFCSQGCSRYVCCIPNHSTTQDFPQVFVISQDSTNEQSGSSTTLSTGHSQGCIQLVDHLAGPIGTLSFSLHVVAAEPLPQVVSLVPEPLPWPFSPAGQSEFPHDMAAGLQKGVIQERQAQRASTSQASACITTANDLLAKADYMVKHGVHVGGDCTASSMTPGRARRGIYQCNNSPL